MEIRSSLKLHAIQFQVTFIFGSILVFMINFQEFLKTPIFSNKIFKKLEFLK